MTNGGSARPARRLRVAMVGPALSARSGLSAVANSHLAAMPADAPSIHYVPMLYDGSKLVKAAAALLGTIHFVATALFWRPHVVHVHMSSRASYHRKAVIVRLALSFGLGVILHVHGSEFHVFFDESDATLRSAITRTLESADIVIALSQEWHGRLARIAPRARIRVLTNPVVVADFERAVRERGDVPEGGGSILFLGMFGKRKGTYDLVDAAETVVAERPNVIFELGGDHEVAEILERIEAKGLSANFNFMGWVRGRDKIDAFARANLLTLPSYHEGVPISVLEALAAGLPIVTTPVGGIPEVIEDGVNALLVTPGDVEALAAALLKLLSDGELRRRMSAANLEAARTRHDASIGAATLCVWYNEVAAGKVDGPGEDARAGEGTRPGEGARIGEGTRATTRGDG